MRRRLDLAAALMAPPQMTRSGLLVLDEPTTGLDPGSRQHLWAVLAGLRAERTTMLLTTQYLEEADRFADVVMQPIARVNPVSAACAVIRSLASGGSVGGSVGGSLGFPLLVLGCWVLGLFLVPGVLAVRRWQAPT
jgi:ABC-type molybdate transport system ATPase subunit